MKACKSWTCHMCIKIAKTRLTFFKIDPFFKQFFLSGTVSISFSSTSQNVLIPSLKALAYFHAFSRMAGCLVSLALFFFIHSVVQQKWPFLHAEVLHISYQPAIYDRVLATRQLASLLIHICIRMIREMLSLLAPLLILSILGIIIICIICISESHSAAYLLSVNEYTFYSRLIHNF